MEPADPDSPLTMGMAINRCGSVTTCTWLFSS